MKNEQFTVLESDLIKKLGISRDLARQFRERLNQGEDYGRRGRYIAYTVAAATRLSELAGFSDKPDPEPLVPPNNGKPMLALPLIAGTVYMLRVWKAADHGVTNRGMVIAYLDGTDPENPINHMRVTVPNNVNFTRHMLLPARLEKGNHFVLWNTQLDVPGRAPRRRGTW